MDLTEGSETSTIINQTPGNYPKESLLYSVQGESLKSRILHLYGEETAKHIHTSHFSLWSIPDRRFRNVGNYKPDVGELP